MARSHLFVIVVLLGAAAVAGLLAVTRTVSLGAGAASASTSQVAAKERALDRLEAELRRALARRPPALPPVRTTAAAPSAPRTISVRSSAPSAVPSAVRHEDGERWHDGHELAERGLDGERSADD